MARLAKIANPLVSPRPRQRQEAEALYAQMSDEDLTTLLSLHDLKDRERLPRWPDWALPLVEQIVSRTAARMSKAKEDAQRTSSCAETGDDFSSLLAAYWERADDALRRSLRTIAAALGIPLPTEPMRRLRPPGSKRPAASAGSAPAAIAAPRAGGGLLRDGRKRRRPLRPSMPAPETEDAWTPCASLFDALHPDNRGWS